MVAITFDGVGFNRVAKARLTVSSSSSSQRMLRDSGATVKFIVDARRVPKSFDYKRVAIGLTMDVIELGVPSIPRWDS